MKHTFRWLRVNSGLFVMAAKCVFDFSYYNCPQSLALALLLFPPLPIGQFLSLTPVRLFLSSEALKLFYLYLLDLHFPFSLPLWMYLPSLC